jgi:hypothetical protein
MGDKMQVVLVKQTGHVLAAFTRKADPEGKPTLSTLFGRGLLVRNRTVVSPSLDGGETLVAPSDSLDVAVVDYDPDVFNNPRGFVVGGGQVAKLGADLPKLDTASPPASSPLTFPPTTLIKFSTSRLTVELDVNTTDNKGVCIVFQEAQPLPGDEPERRIAQGSIASGTHFISLDLKTSLDGSLASIPDKDFSILALIAGYQPLFGKQSPAP